MEYEDGEGPEDSESSPSEDEDEENEEPSDASEDPMAALAGMAAGKSSPKKGEKKGKASAAAEEEGAWEMDPKAKKLAEIAKKKEQEAARRKDMLAQKAKEEAARQAKRKGLVGGMAARISGGPRMRKGFASKFAQEKVDTEVALDSLHRARTARMNYSQMVTYAAFHAGGKDKVKKAVEDKDTTLARNVRKARSKSLEKKGPAIHEGESHYQYLMRKKREEAEEKMLEKEAEKEERWRAREDKYEAEQAYRERLEDEYRAAHPEEFDPPEEDDQGSEGSYYSDD